ncbi:MAG: sugar porter family MFS transporter [Bacteroidota bacterium]
MNTNSKIFFWSLVTSLGGFLFGFDTAVISGAEQAIQKLWGLSDAMTGVMLGTALYGTILGALLGGIPTEILGRKTTLFWIGVLYLISAVGSAMAPDVNSLMFFRFIGGIGVGASSVAAPVYISEIAPTERRGRLTALFQFNLVLGILIAYVSNVLIGNEGAESWRTMLGVEAVPALLFVILILFVPKSPRWLALKKGDQEGAKAILDIINPGQSDEALREILDAPEPQAKGLSYFFSGKFNGVILLAFLFAFFNQASGINAIIYYAPRVFESAGLGASTALLSSAGVGIVNLIFTMLGLYLIDRAGRKTLMYIGSLGYIFALIFMSMAFFFSWEGMLVPIFTFAFIASHAVGQGAVIWVFISEIFPNEVRGWGMSLGSGTHWVFAALIASIFPYFEGILGGGPIFAFFAIMMVGQLFYVWKMMPETKGVSLEELEKELT